MENYSKARSVDQPSVCPFSLTANTPEVRVKDGSKIRNLLRYVLDRMEVKPEAAAHEEGGGGVNKGPPLCRQLVLTASGKGVSKAITCAELLKRRVRGLHQLTQLANNTVTDVWEPLEPAAGLDSLTVSRKLPAIWILLSRDPLDRQQPGYQAPGRFDGLWAHTHASTREEGGGRGAHKRKRGCGGGARGRGRSRDFKADS
ncbi:ribonuclease P protein subunit p25-like protein [Dunckerocampus dactyliophorus]|uniref:ribonuclease P protein subunit p25-like protein n=1 Tax=Dunckerocampus dactyliophorus TaxID=161453 RepID=UPI002406C6B6|nr:ribonuclease P protein subunit p25-like protein [Dunckerocampus dactyliophorus]XP_054638779.1 ribonuclease P protein subunit p25-like protein [Dunckerocampus dactyliophorus]XP_054638780.1 ribonuclease P protein subunit p25-like protein [Dunckerocampus dactyliophorus]XP_054638781.1 ribonuclease P protein subunit p25-like protein [Dunckerocampus dactyliophorus]